MPTKYRVLRAVMDGKDETLVHVLDVETHGPTTAIKRAADSVGMDEGDEEVFVAVPISNWTRQDVVKERPPARLRVADSTGPAPAPIPGQTALTDEETDGD